MFELGDVGDCLPRWAAQAPAIIYVTDKSQRVLDFVEDFL